MAYEAGEGVLIPLGKGCLQTDDSQDDIPLNKLVQARNVTIRNGVIEKDFGSKRWNPTSLPAKVIGFFDWWPDDITQYVIVVCSDGKIYRFTDPYNYSEVTALGSAPASLKISGGVHFVQGGQESVTRSRKLFIFSGFDQIQVISGDSTTRRNLGDTSNGAPSGSGPATDWQSNSYPTFGFIHRNRLFVFGNKNFPHMVYASTTANHEDFITVLGGDKLITYNVYPGESDGNFTAYVYKGKVILFKYPLGAYGLAEGDSLDTAYFQKLNTDFGSASRHSAVQAKDDLLVANSEGSITSIAAAFQLGDIKAADLMTSLRNESFMRFETNQSKNDGRWAIYYPDKKVCFFTYQSSSGYRNDRILVLDLSRGSPEMSWSDKDQANCLGLIRDVKKILRPYYGSDDGHLYLLDSEDRRGPIHTPEESIVTLSSGGAIDIGDHKYKVTYYDSIGETPASEPSNTLTTSSGNQKGILTLPIDKTGRAVGRKIYRNSISSPAVYKLLATVANNNSNSYTDIIADATLGAAYSVVGNTTYSGYQMVAQTPHTNLGSDKTKVFQFLEVSFEATGNWSLYADIVIDGVFKETVEFPIYYGSPLDSFKLDRDKLIGRAPRSVRKPIHGQGRRISIRFRQSGYLQQVKITSCRVYLKTSDERQKAQAD